MRERNAFLIGVGSRGIFGELASMGQGADRAMYLLGGPCCVLGALWLSQPIIYKAASPLGVENRFLGHSDGEAWRKCVFQLEAWQMHV